MWSPRRKAVSLAIGVLLCGWAVALIGFQVARNARVTPEKVAVHLRSVDLKGLSAEERAAALRDLARKMSALSIEDRRRARLNAAWEKWFAEMTDQEKIEFVEATLPSGFKQMLTSFEELPEARRRQAIDRAMTQLQKAREAAAQEQGADIGKEGAETLSPELQQRVVQLGLKSYYSQSSAQTKAELAPLLEEMQRLMESGMLFRGRRFD